MPDGARYATLPIIDLAPLAEGAAGERRLVAAIRAALAPLPDAAFACRKRG